MMSQDWTRGLTFFFGLVFVLGIAASAIFFPAPTTYQYTVFRIILALAAAGFSSLLPGFLNVELKNGIRAGGALAVFVIVYFFAPAALPLPADRSDLARQADFAYSSIFGPKPGSIQPPLAGARIEIGSLPDATTGRNSSTLVKSVTLKLLVPYYIGTRCPGALFRSAVIAETLSPYLTRPVDIFIFNVAAVTPNRNVVAEFLKRWRFGPNVHFLSGSGKDFIDFSRKSVILSMKSGDHIDYSTTSYVFGPRGEPLWVYSDEFVDDVADLKLYRSILYYIAHSYPELINRDILARRVPSNASLLVSAAWAQTKLLPLDQTALLARERRVALMKRVGEPVRCRDR